MTNVSHTRLHATQLVTQGFVSRFYNFQGVTTEKASGQKQSQHRRWSYCRCYYAIFFVVGPNRQDGLRTNVSEHGHLLSSYCSLLAQLAVQLVGFVVLNMHFKSPNFNIIENAVIKKGAICNNWPPVEFRIPTNRGSISTELTVNCCLLFIHPWLKLLLAC